MINSIHFAFLLLSLKVNYVNYDLGKPSNFVHSNGIDQDCTSMAFGLAWKWNDMACQLYDFPHICKRDQVNI